MILVGIVLNALVLTSTGIAGCVSSTAALYYIAYTMNFAQAVYAPTIGAASWVICAEVSSLELRARTQGLATISNALTSWVLNFITPYLINTDQGKSIVPQYLTAMNINISQQTWVVRPRSFGLDSAV